MSFLQPIMLFALPLAMLPIIVHLINLRRHKTVHWGAMMFLLAATQRRRGKTRLRHLLILLARMLAVAALIFVVSRPLAGRWFGWLGGSPDTVLLLLDRSASMSQHDLQSGQSKLAAGVAQFQNALTRAGMPRQLILIEGTSNRPRPIRSVAELAELADTDATDIESNIPAMMQAALEFIVDNQTGRTDVWICSDLQSSDWRDQSGQWEAIRNGFQELPQPVRFHLLAYDQSPSDNLSVRVDRLRRVRSEESDQLVMDVQIRSASEQDERQVPVNIVLDGARSVADVQMKSSSYVLSDYVIPIEQGRDAGWGKVELPNDENPRDNVFYFSYGQDVQQQAAIVSDQAGSAWPLSLAVAPPTDRIRSKAQSIPPDQWREIAWQDTALLLWQAALPVGEAKDAVTKFVENGGYVIFFPPGTSTGGMYMDIAWGPWRNLEASDDQQAITFWRDDSDLLAHTDSGDPLPLNKLTITKYRQVEGNLQPLARLQNEALLLARRPTDKGGVYVMTTLPQRPYSDFAEQGVAFFVAVQRALNRGSERLRDSQFGIISIADQPDQANRWTVTASFDQAINSTQRPFVAGVYQFQDRYVARNRPASEDNATKLVDHEVEKVLAGLDYRLLRDTVDSRRWLVTEIWQVFVLCVLAALIVEAALCFPDVRPRKVALA